MEEKSTQSPQGLQGVYRIGPYARYMGVTPDLLKHYEQFHLIESTASESGYRYYPFFQSSRLLDALTLRGYDFPLREISDLLRDADPVEIRQALDARGRELERELLFRQAVLEEQRWFSAWLDRMAHKTWDRREAELGPLCFLPHTRRRDFLSDERIYAILKDWTDWMPVVKSCLEIPPSAEDLSLRNGDEYFCGLILPLELAQKYAIPLNSMVKEIPRQKWLICDYLLPLPDSDPQHPGPTEVLQKELEGRPTPPGAIYSVRLLNPRASGRSTPRFRMGYFLVPLE